MRGWRSNWKQPIAKLGPPMGGLLAAMTDFYRDTIASLSLPLELS